MDTHQNLESTGDDDLRRVLPWLADRDLLGIALWLTVGMAVASFLVFLVLFPNREILLSCRSCWPEPACWLVS